MAKLYSRRGLLLVDEVAEVPVLTVELYCKWYSLFLIKPDGDIE